MRYLAIATDGDGTLMRGGRLARGTVAALRRWRKAGGKLLLVTGETTKDLCEFPHLDLFDQIVAENGALVAACDLHKQRPLVAPPPAKLISALRRAGVTPLHQGHSVIETKRSQARAVNKTLLQLGIEWSVALNRKDIILLPRGVTKATGLTVALGELGIRPQQVVGVGDAENDVPLLDYCGLGVAVANAVPILKQRAALVTAGGHGKGVCELIDRLLADEKPPRQRKRAVDESRS